MFRMNGMRGAMDGKERSTFSAGTSKTLEWNEGHVLALRRESPESLAEE